MPRVLQIAMQNALGLQGVAVVGLSGDVAMQLVEDTDLKHHALVKKPAIRPCDHDLEELAGLINNSSRVTLLCGAGCAGAQDELMKLGETILSPIEIGRASCRARVCQYV